jgi:Fic family protein
MGASLNDTDPKLKPLDLDPRRADAAYKGFPAFSEWSDCAIDQARWERYTHILKELEGATPEVLRNALHVVSRAAAIDTGAIEGLYDVDKGFTFTVATQAAAWEIAMMEKGPQVRPLFESQLEAYDHVLDFATQRVPIAEAWIRHLHSVICRAQETYLGYTELGPQEIRLPKGDYKHLPNHVIGRDGLIHSYAPVDLTPSEMHRLCLELNSDAFLSAHPALQAAYAHYSFVSIHPFADGNGRVSRALASVFTYRNPGVPILILAENRAEYISALSAADAGEYQPFVTFMAERTFDAIQMAHDSLMAVGTQPVEESLASIKQLYRTKGGYTHQEVDEAGIKLLELLRDEIARKLQGVESDEVHVSLSFGPVHYKADRDGYRLIKIQAINALTLDLSTKPPAKGQVRRAFGVVLPVGCGAEDDLVLRDLSSGETLETRITTLIPSVSSVLTMRLRMWAERIVPEAVEALAKAATEDMKKRGYR